MNPSQLGELVAKAREAQSRLAELQRDLARRRYEGTAGGGMVTAVVSGALRVLEVRIEPDFHAAGDREMLQDLVAAAVNTALEKAQREVQEEIQRQSARFTIPFPGGGSPGPAGGAPGSSGGE